ncbi:hypothetical protein [Hydrogenimonas sp.]
MRITINSDGSASFDEETLQRFPHIRGGLDADGRLYITNLYEPEKKNYDLKCRLVPEGNAIWMDGESYQHPTYVMTDGGLTTKVYGKGTTNIYEEGYVSLDQCIEAMTEEELGEVHGISVNDDITADATIMVEPIDHEYMKEASCAIRHSLSLPTKPIVYFGAFGKRDYSGVERRYAHNSFGDKGAGAYRPSDRSYNLYEYVLGGKYVVKIPMAALIANREHIDVLNVTTKMADILPYLLMLDPKVINIAGWSVDLENGRMNMASPDASLGQIIDILSDAFYLRKYDRLEVTVNGVNKTVYGYDLGYGPIFYELSPWQYEITEISCHREWDIAGFKVAPFLSGLRKYRSESWSGKDIFSYRKEIVSLLNLGTLEEVDIECGTRSQVTLSEGTLTLWYRNENLFDCVAAIDRRYDKVVVDSAWMGRTSALPLIPYIGKSFRIVGPNGPFATLESGVFTVSYMNGLEYTPSHDVVNEIVRSTVENCDIERIVVNADDIKRTGEFLYLDRFGLPITTNLRGIALAGYEHLDSVVDDKGTAHAVDDTEGVIALLKRICDRTDFYFQEHMPKVSGRYPQADFALITNIPNPVSKAFVTSVANQEAEVEPNFRMRSGDIAFFEKMTEATREIAGFLSIFKERAFVVEKTTELFYGAMDFDSDHGSVILYEESTDDARVWCRIDTDFNVSHGASAAGMTFEAVDGAMVATSDVVEQENVSPYLVKVIVRQGSTYYAVKWVNFNAMRVEGEYNLSLEEARAKTLPGGMTNGFKPTPVSELNERRVVYTVAPDGEGGFDVSYRVIDENGDDITNRYETASFDGGALFKTLHGGA